MIINKEKREDKLKQVLTYVKDEIKKGNYPSYRELNQKFNVHRYKITLIDIYTKQGMNILKIPIHKSGNCKKILQKELINYIKKETDKGHFPTRRYIESKFKVRIAPNLFESIKDLYNQAGIKYKQENSQELKNEKAKILTRIIISLLSKLDLKLIELRGVHDRGIDVIAEDNEGKIVGIEIKAYNKYEPIKRRTILQLKRFFKTERLDKVVLVTTTSKFEKNLEIQNINIIAYGKLKKLCTDNQLGEIEYIRNLSVHKETNEKELKKQRIIDYTKEAVKNGRDITGNKILKDLNLDVYTYFNSINDIYIEAGLLPPLKKIGGRRRRKRNKYYSLIIDRMLEYMRMEISKGHYPSGDDVGKKFGVKHIWNFVTMAKLYNKLGIAHYYKRKLRF